VLRLVLAEPRLKFASRIRLIRRVGGSDGLATRGYGVVGLIQVGVSLH
jgi:hypothetical protein